MSPRKRRLMLLGAINRDAAIDEVMNIMLKDPKAVRWTDTKKNYPLHAACSNAQYETVIMKLLEIYPQAVQQKNADGTYPLHIACSCRGQSSRVILQLVEIFPEAVSTTRLKYGNEYPLRLACEHIQSEAVIQKLIEVHALALHEQDKWTRYPIHYAISGQSVDIIKLIINADQRVLHQVDGERRTLLHFGCMYNYANFVEYLLQHTAININARDGHNETPLHFACRYGLQTVIQMLLRHRDIDVNNTGDFQNSPLHYVIGNYFNDLIGYFENRLPIVQMLLDHPCIIIDQKNIGDKTPLDFINDKIHQIENLDDSDDKKLALPSCLETRRLLEEFPCKRRWHAYDYFIRDFEGW